MENEGILVGLRKYINAFKVAPGKKVSLKTDYHTRQQQELVQKEQSKQMLKTCTKEISDLQERLYADNRHSLLIVLQGMDAAGKDSMIKQVYSGINPQGVRVTSFKAPSAEELDHGYLWRHNKSLPARGEIAVFNRSHYENVLITRVHPEYILAENLPDTKTVKDIDKKFWQKRYDQINSFEKTVAENGTLILKFYLHLSKKEQKERFLERIEKPSKNWKFSEGDLEERKHWKEYMEAYEEMLNATSTTHAPWFVLPADSKWFARLAMAMVIVSELTKLQLEYPTLADDAVNGLQGMRQRLMEEEE